MVSDGLLIIPITVLLLKAEANMIHANPPIKIRYFIYIILFPQRYCCREKYLSEYCQRLYPLNINFAAEIVKMKIKVICFIILFTACNNPIQDTDTVETIPETPSAEKKLKDLVTKHPDSLALIENLVQFYQTNEDYSKALKEVDAALVNDSLNARLWNIKAILHYEDADTIKAIHSLEKAVMIFPDPKYLVDLGNLYAQTKNVFALKIADGLIKVNSSKFEKDAYYIKGRYFSFMLDKEKAISFFDKCLNLNYTFMDAYREKAIALYDMGKYETALTVLDKALTLQNNFDEGYYYSGRCLEKLNRKEEAIQSYKNALVYDPDYMEAKDALARLVVN